MTSSRDCHQPRGAAGAEWFVSPDHLAYWNGLVLLLPTPLPLFDSEGLSPAARRWGSTRAVRRVPAWARNPPVCPSTTHPAENNSMAQPSTHPNTAPTPVTKL